MGSLRSRLVLLAATALVLARSPSIAAQPVTVTPGPATANEAIASQLVDEGIAAQTAKDYAKAIELYTKAYNLLPHPLVLFDIAQAHRLAGRIDEAVRFYERYLSADPDGEKAGTAHAMLASIVKASRTEPAPATETAPDMSSAALRAAPASPGQTLRVAGIISGAAGLACVGAALAFGLRMESIEQEQLNRGRMGLPYDPERVRAGKAAERDQFIAIALSGTLLAGGVVQYWMGYRQSRAARGTAWTPMIGPDLAGIAVTGTLP